ncbi:MAG: A/G-specific adenine glycosylase [Candidatus Omnitrophica bacterium]|nr:A/G-specific adenine glycosylase [Candidatus Omnitrophota bacterium]
MHQLKNTRKIQDSLLAWYRINKRDLPWRKTRDPYAIWISEIMLQQTQVDTVIPYFNQWLKRFPNVKTLAASDENEVLKAWEGLGYYTRARNLHRAAKEIITKYNGKIPETKDVIMTLPGIGRYTAGAILSIAFNQPVALVDGNVMRVFSRLFDIHSDVAAQTTQKKIWALAGALVPEKNPGDFNQALMELGATICTNGSPSCLICPLAGECISLEKSDPSQLPVKKIKTKIQKFSGWIFVIENKGKFLIEQRPAGQVMGGLWEFPSLMKADADHFPNKETVGKIKAAFTKFRGEYRVARINYKPGLFKKDKSEIFCWITPKEFSKFTFSAPSRKVLELVFQVKQSAARREPAPQLLV